MIRISLIDELQGECGICRIARPLGYFDSDLRCHVCYACLPDLVWVQRAIGGGLEGVRAIDNDGEAALLRLREPLRSPALAERIERRARR